MSFGIVTNLYAYMAFLLVILTYGMETGFFRFASKRQDKDRVYSSALVSLFVTSLAFVLAVFNIYRYPGPLDELPRAPGIHTVGGTHHCF